jgi:hypothetical protein
MVFATSTLGLIKAFGPRAEAQGTARKFVQALSNEFGTGESANARWSVCRFAQ